jgi:hypothetical protein
MKQNTGAARGVRIAVRLSREDRYRIAEAVKARGYTSPTASIRAGIQNELNGRPELTETGDRIVGGFERMSRYNLRTVPGQQALRACWILSSKQFLRACRSHPTMRGPKAIARAEDR